MSIFEKDTEAESFFRKIQAKLAGTAEDFYYWRNRPLRDGSDGGKVKPAHQLGIMNRENARRAGVRTRRMTGRMMVVPGATEKLANRLADKARRG